MASQHPQAPNKTKIPQDKQQQKSHFEGNVDLFLDMNRILFLRQGLVAWADLKLTA